MTNLETVLEIEKIKEKIKFYTKTKIGAKKVDDLKSSKDFKYVSKELCKLKETMEVLSIYNDFPILSELDMYEEISYAKKGNVFNEITLNAIKQEIQTTVDTIKYSLKIKESIYFLSLYLSKGSNPCT